MRKRYLSAIVAAILLTFPLTAGAAPLTGSLGSSGAGSFDSGSVSGSLGSAGFWGSLAPDEDETYEEVDPASGTLIATSGFVVDRDGFNYQNWGKPTAAHPRSLVPASMQMLYGDEICARLDGGECVLTATGQALQTDLNDFLAGGHCYGFAAASGLFSTGVIVKGDYLQPGTDVFANDPSDQVDGLISRYASTQYSSPTLEGMTQQSVSDTLEMILEAWDRNDNYVLAVFGEVGGHAVTPIALRELGDGKTGIVIYDNNFPGVEKMVVTDPAANTWYYTAMLNPTTPAYLFVGSPENQMELSQMTTSTQVQECPTCVDGDESVLVMVKDNSALADPADIAWDFEITLPGGAAVPGMEPRRLINLQKAALFSIPANTPFEINLVGPDSGEAGEADVSVYGDGWINEIDDIVLDPGATAKVSVGQDQRTLSLTGSTVLEPRLMFAADQADRSVSVRGEGLRLDPDSTLTIGRAVNGDVVYGIAGAGPTASMQVDVRRVDKIGEQRVRTDGPVTLPAGAEASVPVGAWDGVSPLAVHVLGAGVDELYPMTP